MISRDPRWSVNGLPRQQNEGRGGKGGEADTAANRLWRSLPQFEDRIAHLDL